MNFIKQKSHAFAGILAVLIITAIIPAIFFYNKNTVKEISNTQPQETETITPKVLFTERYLFTNNLKNISFDDIIDEVSGCSDWSAKLIRFEKHGNLEELNEQTLKELTDLIPLPCDATELSALGTEDLPTEEGIYRAVLKVSDKSGNYTLEEIYLIYDTTGARIHDTPDKTIHVEQADLDKTPEIDKSDYTITDNVDGKISNENIHYELELRDADKHEWLVHVSYTDRAGNESKAEFLITVKEKKNETAGTQDDLNDHEHGETSSVTPDTSNENSNTIETNYDPADANKDGMVDGDEASEYMHPTEQAVIDAGYGVVVQLDETTYSVLTHGDANVNGKHGFDILAEYLASKGLYANNMSGCWIDSDRDLYRCIATNIIEIPSSDDEESWD